MEAGCLALFMISACGVTALLQHPSSPLRQAIENDFLRRVLIGIAMGLTLIGIVHTSWGKRSGAHMNPVFTWTFYRLNKVQAPDALFYSIAQICGGIAGVLISAVILQDNISNPAVLYAVTVPGPGGQWPAFAGEVAISFILMMTVLNTSNSPAWNRYTPFFAGALVATFITFESPYSGMSMNPARTIGSAVSANVWTSVWIYFIAPATGMFLAAETYLRLKTSELIYCAKYHHHNNQRCIFRCNFAELLKKSESHAQQGILQSLKQFN